MSIHFVVLFEGDGTGTRIRQLFGLSQEKAEAELTAATYRKVDTLLNTARAFTASIDDMLGLELLDETSGKLFFRTLLNPDPIQALYFHIKPGDRLDYAMPDTDIQVHADHLWMDSYHLMAATVKATPLKPRPADIATALSRVNCDFIACMEWKPQTAMHMRKIINARKRVFNGQQVNMLMSAVVDTPPEGRPRQHDLEHHEANLGQSLIGIEQGFQFGAFSCVIILLGEDYHRDGPKPESQL